MTADAFLGMGPDMAVSKRRGRVTEGKCVFGGSMARKKSVKRCQDPLDRGLQARQIPESAAPANRSFEETVELRYATLLGKVLIPVNGFRFQVSPADACRGTSGRLTLEIPVV